MPGFWGSALGVVDLVLRQQGGKWAVAEFTCSTRQIAERDDAVVRPLAGDDRQVDAAVAPEHSKRWRGSASRSGIRAGP
jgi:2',3'-cyclic-nucleotide 2'-phosphodiesterase / 3'-nucleotidase